MIENDSITGGIATYGLAMNKKMVAGFLFVGDQLLLVQKTHPSWQAGLFNGIGGGIEPNETPVQAMEREFEEEVNYPDILDWRHFATEIEPFGAYVYFFVAKLERAADASYVWPSVNDVGEKLVFVRTDQVPRGACIGNLSWLVPLAQDWRNLDPVVVTAKGDIRERAAW